MKKHKKRTLQLKKISVAIIHELELKAIKGGSEPVSIGIPMSQAPDEQTVCYALE
jgi:hypothetical protein